jgi:hypothetical protein
MEDYMNRCFRLLLQAVAALVAIPWVALTVILILLLNTETLLLSSWTYDTALAREHVYSRLPAIIVDTVLAQAPKTWELGNLLPYADAGAKSCAWTVLGEENYGEIISSERQPAPSEITQMANCGIGKPDQKQTVGELPPDTMKSLLNLLLTPQLLKSMTDSVLAQAFGIIGTPGAPYNLVLSLKDFKASASGPDVTDALIKTYFDIYPACPSWASPLPPVGPVTGSASPLLAPIASPTGMCHVPEDIYLQYKTQFDQLQSEYQAAGLINNQPTQVDILESVRTSDAFSNALARFPIDWRWYVQDLRWVNRLGWIVIFVLLFLIGLLAVRSWRDLRLWLGIPILLTGMTLLVVGLLFLIATHGALYYWLRDATPAYAPAFKAAGGLLGAIARIFGLVTEGEGFVLTMAGLALALPALNARPKI